MIAAKRNRSPSIVFGCISVAILVLMMTALNQAQPPPPPTPEYAPEAIQALRNPPLEQTSRQGKGPLGSGDQANGASPEPSPSIIYEEDRVRHCVGGRQIEDTQSPPCVAYWDPARDNGGSTWKGVTKNEIRVAVGFEENEDLLELFVTFVNRRFEFYGRKIVLVNPDCKNATTPAQMKQCAQTVNSLGVFASTSFKDVGGNQQFYYDALADFGIVSVSAHPDMRTEAHLAKFAPHQWTYLPSFDKVGAHLASFICRQLATPGARATHGGADVVTKARKFGFVYNTIPDSPSMDVRAFKNGLSACGVTPKQATVKYVPAGPGGQYTDDESARQVANAIADFRLDDVTSIACICHSTTTRQLMAAAEGQGYEPEWVVSSYAYHTSNGFMSGQTPPTQARHTVGIDFWNKVVRPEYEPWYWASQEADPTYAYSGSQFTYYAALWLYHQILLLAAGIQMAGPDLRPTTFQEGLWKARFPNPPSPYFEGTVGFEDRDHSMVDDAAVLWWDGDPRAQDPWFRTPGAFCYVKGGTRYGIGTYPRENVLFTGSQGAFRCDRTAGET